MLPYSKAFLSIFDERAGSNSDQISDFWLTPAASWVSLDPGRGHTMLFTVALTIVVVVGLTLAIAAPFWLATIGLSSAAEFFQAHKFRYSRNFVYAVIVLVIVLAVQTSLPHPVAGPFPFWAALVAVYYFAFFGSTPSTPSIIRPGERILQRHASGSGGQLGGSQLMQTADLMRLGYVRQGGGGFPHIGLIGGIPIIYPGDGHLLTIAPAGSGKSSGPVAANLLCYPGSIIATDPKGELASLTAHWRAEMKINVYVIDPWGIVPIEDIPGGKRATFNPLDLIPGGWDRGEPFEGPDSIDNAHLLADALIVEGSKTDPYWDRTAKGLLTGLLLIAALDPVWKWPRTLTAVNDRLAMPADDFLMFLTASSKTPLTAAAAALNQYLSKSDKEASGVLSTVNTNMRFLQGSAMQQAFSGSSIDWRPSSEMVLRFICAFRRLG